MLAPCLVVFAFLSACSQEPRLEGQVVDIWGTPVEGATVVLEGQSERPLTDSNGGFSLPLEVGKHKMKAGREGYIQEHMEVEVVEGAAPPHPVFQLYPKPEDAGFYVVGNSAYSRLEPKPVEQIGNELAAVRGLPELGEVHVDSGKLRVLFHTPLKMDQVMRLGLHLKRLDYLREQEMPGGVAMTVVPINLWIAKDDVTTDIQPLRSRNDYLIETSDELAPGAYAFETQGLLEAGSAQAFNDIPEPLRVAYPVELR